MSEKASRIAHQQLVMIRSEKDQRQARVHYHETVGMLRGFCLCEVIDSMQLIALTQIAGSAYINAGKPW